MLERLELRARRMVELEINMMVVGRSWGESSDGEMLTAESESNEWRR